LDVEERGDLANGLRPCGDDLIDLPGGWGVPQAIRTVGLDRNVNVEQGRPVVPEREPRRAQDVMGFDAHDARGRPGARDLSAEAGRVRARRGGGTSHSRTSGLAMTSRSPPNNTLAKTAHPGPTKGEAGT